MLHFYQQLYFWKNKGNFPQKLSADIFRNHPEKYENGERFTFRDHHW